jgi:uncharacterized protein YbaR (Trm112 family)
LGFHRGDLVLDVGSGHKPHPRADVLCDKYFRDNRERSGDLVQDRPLVVADIAALPFRSKSFDYVICQHVIEHVSDAGAALTEISRVGKRGYIETPSPLWEKLMGRAYHLWFVESDGRKLILRRKQTGSMDRNIVTQFVKLAESNPAWSKVVLDNFDLFYTTLHWDSDVTFEIHPADAPLAQESLAVETEDWPGRSTPLPRWERVLKKLSFALLRQTARSRPKIDFWSLLVCPACKGDVSRLGETELVCLRCSIAFPVRNTVPIMLLGEATQILPAERRVAPSQGK